MADYVKTITNSVNLFALAPSTKWGQSFGAPYTMTWGTTKWGYGSFNQIFSIGKNISNSLSMDSSLQLNTSKVLSSTIAVTSDLSSEQLKNGSWNYVFPSNASDGENRDFTSWADGSDASTSFTCLAASTSTWS